jgi:hypothetical protein
MTRGNRRDRIGAIVALGLFVVALMTFLSLSLRADNVIAASFRLDDIQICEELDDDMKPVNPASNLLSGVKQVCLWFEYSRAREGDLLEIFWSFSGQKVQKDSYRLFEPAGTRAFYLLKEDGSSLPEGSYSVALYCNGRERKVQRFNVEGISGDKEIAVDDALD